MSLGIVISICICCVLLVALAVVVILIQFPSIVDNLKNLLRVNSTVPEWKKVTDALQKTPLWALSLKRPLLVPMLKTYEVSYKNITYESTPITTGPMRLGAGEYGTLSVIMKNIQTGVTNTFDKSKWYRAPNTTDTIIIKFSAEPLYVKYISDNQFDVILKDSSGGDIPGKLSPV